MIGEEQVTLATLAGGAASERFADALAEVGANILDPNTDPEAAREIVLRVKAKPSRNDRGKVAITISCTKKLAGAIEVTTQVFLGRVSNRVVVVESNPNQLDLFRAAGVQPAVEAQPKPAQQPTP